MGSPVSERPNLGDDKLISEFLKRQSKKKAKVSAAYSSQPKKRRVNKKAGRPKDYDQPSAHPENLKFVYDVLYRNVDSKFWNRNCVTRFESINNREIISERQINLARHKDIKDHIENLLKQVGLFKTTLYPKSYFPELVKKFYANLNDEVFDRSDECVYGRVFVRGTTFDFTPELINKYVDSYNVPYNPVDELKNIDFRAISSNLTGKELEVKGTTVKAADLTLCASILHKIAKVNWLPAKQTSILYRDLAVLIYNVKNKRIVNFGEHVFVVIKECSSEKTVSSMLPFPCLISNILISQVEAILRTNEKPLKCPHAIYISSKLLKEGHLNDIWSSKGKEKEAGPSGVKETGIRKFLIKQLDEISAKRDDLDREEMEINKLLQTLPVEVESDDS